VSDRDVVIKAQAKFNPDTARGILLSQATEEHEEPEKKGRIRIARLTNVWVLECVMADRNKTRVTYNAKADPGGYIPSAIVNKQSEDQPYDALMGMRKMVQEPKYIKAAQSKDAFLSKEEIDKFYENEQRIQKIRENRMSLFEN
jgi:hypothetical protein